MPKMFSPSKMFLKKKFCPWKYEKTGLKSCRTGPNPAQISILVPKKSPTAGLLSNDFGCYSPFILRKRLHECHFFQNCGTFNTNQKKKYHNFKRNQIFATAFLKWTDFNNWFLWSIHNAGKISNGFFLADLQLWLVIICFSFYSTYTQHSMR
jgi:hypothetical protein